MISKKKIAVVGVFLICAICIFAVASMNNTHDNDNTEKIATITFDMNGGTGTPIEPIKAPLNTKVKMPTFDWTKDGCEIVGSTYSGAELVWEDGVQYIIPLNENVRYTVLWQPIQ